MTFDVFSPYRNLIIAGYMGVGKNAVVRAIAARLKVPFADLDTEIQKREGYTPDQLRDMFGEARLRAVEDAVCHDLSLQRGAVLSVGAVALLDETNRERLLNNGILLVLTCRLDEMLRRLHVQHGARFHDPKVRAAEIHKIRQEQAIHSLGALHTLDTTALTPEGVAEQAIAIWRAFELTEQA